MIVCRHPDGRVVVMASEFGSGPLMKDGANWVPAVLTGEQLNEFEAVDDDLDRYSILIEALCGLDFTVNERLGTIVEKDVYGVKTYRDATGPELKMWGMLVPETLRLHAPF